ncbi:hypothetical protein JL100_032520 (plasmid) [Skermanella mucosa]|uniref:hypothetical protein n=1 Tax=Skermanella mucosa TaxID=1789672 RepID=UPI00192C6C6C|nr:hypothetical protein [Skermanella mucosa]UEM24353.1 hypothetical protein JL100_032520 [Skermanella mucosa]
MAKRILNRREFIRSAGTAAASVVVLAGATTLLASNGAWAMTLQTLPQREAEVLLKVARHLYPHEMLGDIYYAEVVEAFDAKMAASPELMTLVKTGIADLDSAYGMPWITLSKGYQLDALKRIEAGKFFQTLRGHTVVALYNNKNIWPTFGYQGSSAEQGGYLFRGFQDAGWTVEPDAEASPPAFTG